MRELGRVQKCLEKGGPPESDGKWRFCPDQAEAEGHGRNISPAGLPPPAVMARPCYDSSATGPRGVDTSAGMPPVPAGWPEGSPRLTQLVPRSGLTMPHRVSAVGHQPPSTGLEGRLGQPYHWWRLLKQLSSHGECSLREAEYGTVWPG